MAENIPERSSREAKGIYFDVKKKPFDIQIYNH